MLTKNYQLWTIGYNNPQITSFSGVKTTVGNVGGQASSNAAHSAGINAYYTNTNSGMYIDVGFGTTAETVDDYKLADSNSLNNNSLLTYLSTTVSMLFPDYSVTSIYRNDTVNPITVTEIGLCTKGNSANNSVINCLLTRVVLDTPVVIQPGEIKSFTITLRCN